MNPQNLNRIERVVESSGRLTLRFYQFLDNIVTTLNQSSMPVSEIDFTDSPYTVTLFSQCLMCDCTAGNIVINLPSVSLGMEYNFIKTDATANTVTINSADGIIGSPSQVLTSQYDSPVLIAGSTEFYLK